MIANDVFCMRRRHAVATGFLLFPVVLAAITMLGFALGVTIGKWNAAIALGMTLGGVYMLSPDGRAKNVLWTLCGIILSICLAGLFVMYTVADAEAYHRPAAVLLAGGWNPLRVTEVSDLVDIVGGGRRPWCVAFIPRMSYVLGAALYHWVGFIEAADALNVLMLFSAAIFVYDWLGSFVRRTQMAVLFAALICSSPVVVGALWGGAMDAAWYLAFLVAVTCACRKMHCPMVLAMLVMSGVKFTGVVMSVVIFAAFGIVALVWHREELWRLVGVGLVTGALILLVNASPYITSTINHGGPFYPSHSFVEREKFADDKNPITYDVMEMNDDARQLGWAGRFAWGYVSQTLVKKYYGMRLNKPDFNPDFKVSGGVGGYGSVFRFFFIMSLALWPFVRRRDINVILGLVLFSVLIQPTIFSGYARYVPQFYLFPVLVLTGIAVRWQSRLAEIIIMIATFVLTAAVNVKPMSMLPLQWLISVQNLQVLTAAGQCAKVYVWSSSNYSRDVLSVDIPRGLEIVRSDADPNVGSKCEIGSYFRFYKVWVDETPVGWYDLSHIVSNNDPSVIATRNARNVRYFLRVFLPNEMRMIPRRTMQLLSLRFRQLRRAITDDSSAQRTVHLQGEDK